MLFLRFLVFNLKNNGKINFLGGQLPSTHTISPIGLTIASRIILHSTKQPKLARTRSSFGGWVSFSHRINSTRNSHHRHSSFLTDATGPQLARPPWSAAVVIRVSQPAKSYLPQSPNAQWCVALHCTWPPKPTPPPKQAESGQATSWLRKRRRCLVANSTMDPPLL